MKRIALIAGLLFAFASNANADVIISEFSNFNLTGTYVQWDNGTFTSGTDDFRVEANDFGGGFHTLAASVDGTGNDAIKIDFDVNAANVADKFNVVMVDGDGTERVFRFDGLAVGDNQSQTVLLTDFLQDNVAGSTAGLDISDIVTFHVQGTFENGDPGVLQDMTFDNLSFVTAVPEPTSVVVLGLVGLGMVTRRRR